MYDMLRFNFVLSNNWKLQYLRQIFQISGICNDLLVVEKDIIYL